MFYSTTMPDNFQQKCLCVLLLDVSGSMKSNNKLDKLNAAIAQFYGDIIEGRNGVSSSTKDRLYVEVISFDQSPHRIQPYKLLSRDTQRPILQSRGSTTDTARAIKFAMDEIQEHKKWCSATGQQYYRPWLVLMTDGKPTSSKEQLDLISQQIRKWSVEKKLFVTAVGIGDKIDLQELNKLSNGHGTHLTDFNFQRFFSWLSESTSKIFDSDDNFDRLCGM